MKPEETDEEPEESASKTSTVVDSSNSQMSQANSQASGGNAVNAADEKPKKKEKLIKNQFNYQDRGTQSGNILRRQNPFYLDL